MSQQRAQGSAPTLPVRIVDELGRIGDYTVTLYCRSCQENLEPDAFADGRLCRRCGKPICDWCYDEHGSFCADCEGRAGDEAFYEAAEVLRDVAMDR